MDGRTRPVTPLCRTAKWPQPRKQSLPCAPGVACSAARGRALPRSVPPDARAPPCSMTDEEFGEIIQCQGDQRDPILKFFIDKKICKKSNVKVHGF